LLWPSPIAGEWDIGEAHAVAMAITPKVLEYGHVLLFGKRVCDAFGVPFVPCQFVPAATLARVEVALAAPHCTFVPLPHPSGRNRLWNDTNVCKLVAHTMALIRQETEHVATKH